MRVAMVTTWNQACGISEYSRDLVYSLKDLGIDIKVFSKRGDTVYRDEDFVKRISWDNTYSFCAHIIDSFDVVHFQNQGSFWSKEFLEGCLKILHEAGIKTVVTFHDSAIWDGFDFNLIDEIIIHREDIFPGAIVNIIPMGIISRPPKICSFGIGRNDDEAVRGICDDLGYVYHVLNPKYKWLSQGELIKSLREYDAIVLWYSEVGIIGCSAGIRMAIASRRPVFVSDVSWFSDVPGNLVTKSSCLQELRDRLKGYFDDDLEKYRKENEWDLVAQQHKEIYE